MPQGKTDRQKFDEAAKRAVERFRTWQPPIDPRTEFSGDETKLRSFLEKRTRTGSGPFELPFDEITGYSQLQMIGNTGTGYPITGQYHEAENSITLNQDRFDPPWDDSSSTYAHELGHFFDIQQLNDEGYGEDVMGKLDKEERANSYGHTLREMAKPPTKSNPYGVVRGFEKYQEVIERVLEQIETMGAERRAAARDLMKPLPAHGR